MEAIERTARAEQKPAQSEASLPPLATYQSMGLAIGARIAATPQRVAINDLDAGRSYTYAEVGQRINGLSDLLKQKGLRPGDSAVTNLDNSSDLIFLLLSTLTSGIRLALIESQTPLARLRHFFNLVNPKAAFLSDAMASEAGALQCQMPWSGNAGQPDQLRSALDPDKDTDREAFVIFSSGTTGEPKGIIHTHGNIIAELNSMIKAYAFRDSMNHSLVLPLAHASGLYRSLIMPLFTGGTVHLRRQFDPGTFWTDIQKQKVDFVQLVPSHVAIINRSPRGPAPGEPLALQFVGTASGYLAPKEQQAFEERFHIPLLQGYGLTECTCGIVLNSRDPAIRRPGVAGLPLDVNEIKVVDSAGIEVEQGEVGEVFVRGKNIARRFVGYDGPEFDEDWMKTGDMGRIEQDGNIVLVGRRVSIINRGAYKIYALEIEEALATLPGVNEAAVIGVPDPVLGQDVVAFVTLDQAVEPAQLLGALRPKLSSFKIPSQIIPIEKMPQNRLGKIVRDELLQLYTRRQSDRSVVDESMVMLRLCRLIADIFAADVSTIKANSSRDTIAQWDSLGHVQVLAAIEQTFGVRIPDEAAVAAQSVNDLANAIVNALRVNATKS